MDGEGFFTKAPCYLECRFTAQSAPGTWPAFWTLTSIDETISETNWMSKKLERVEKVTPTTRATPSRAISGDKKNPMGHIKNALINEFPSWNWVENHIGPPPSIPMVYM